MSIGKNQSELIKVGNMSKDKDIEKNDPAEMAVPERYSDAPEMQPQEEGDTIRLPRLALMQGGQKRPEIAEGLCEDGDLFNTVTKQTYNKEVEVVPVFQLPMTRIRWGPREAGGGLMCVSRNKSKPSGDPGDGLASCEECSFYRNQDPKEGCSNNYELIVLVRQGDHPGAWEPVLLTGTTVKPSDRGVRDMISIARNGYRMGVRLFHKSYVLKSIFTSNKRGDKFWAMTCTPGNKNGKLPEDQINVLESMMKTYQAANINTAGAHGEESTPASKGGDDPPW